MATQLCPKCKKKFFTWYLDDEISNIIIWSCSHCSFQTYEDERDEINCEKCQEETKTFLKNEEEGFWWCSVCNTTSE